MKKEILFPADVWDSSVYGFSQAVKVRDAREVVYISGQTAFDSQGQLVGEDDVETQIRSSFENVKRIVQAAGGDMNNVVKLTVYFLDLDALEQYRAILREYFPDEAPSTTVVEVSRLALPGFLIEVEATAVL
ncbi:MAG: RidA family protein [Rubrobacteraceae bacterium]